MSKHIVQDTEGTIDNRDLKGEKSLEKLPEFVFLFHIERTVHTMGFFEFLLMDEKMDPWRFVK